jgi:DNA-binding MarR family transcriptional regulator
MSSKATARPRRSGASTDREQETEHFLLEEFLPYRLSLLSNRVSEGIARTYRREFGLSVTEWRVIAILGRFPGLAGSEITARGNLDKVAVSRAVGRLQERGLVERIPHDGDQRRQPLRLSENSGRELFHCIVPRALAYERRLLEAIDDEERETLEGLLERLLARAGNLDRDAD